MSIAPALPTVFTRADAARHGFSAAQIRRRVEAGRWVRLRRGVFCTRESATRIDDDRRFRQLVQIAAAITAHDGPCWASHLSARRLHRLPGLRSDRDEVCLTVDPASGAFGRLGDVRILPAAVPADDQTHVGAIPTLSGPRTVVDTLRTLPLDDALVTGDAAIRTGIATQPRYNASSPPAPTGPASSKPAPSPPTSTADARLHSSPSQPPSSSTTTSRCPNHRWRSTTPTATSSAASTSSGAPSA